jgi:DnaJ family protein C protein 3
MELKPGTASVEKELSQLLQAKNALESAYSQSDAGDFSKVLEYVKKIVLVFSPGCLQVHLKDLVIVFNQNSVPSCIGKL